MDIATRAATLFDELVLAVYRSPEKRVMFTWEERIAMTRESTAHLVNSRVEGFSGLMVNYAKHVGAAVIVRGLRAGSDFDGEFQMALTNRRLAPWLETICLIGSQDLMFISSSRIKELALLGGDVSGLVPSPVAARLAVMPRANGITGDGGTN